MEELKKGQVVRYWWNNCKYVVIGYKYHNYILAIEENEEDKFTNRELLYVPHVIVD